MSEDMEYVTFIKKNKSAGELKQLIVPEEFVRDLHYSSPKHLMIMIRVMGRDSAMVRDYFNNSEGEIFSIETTKGCGIDEISGDFTLTSLYLDEGPSLSVDINQEPAMVRILMDLEICD
ncbi:MAG TPA: hypothetical protein VLR54_00945 [Methanobacteriaceae archaeon]|nr:hypothetical protein [Methanobacteriaceae archaeon]